MTVNYKNFTLNNPGDDEPWADIEQQVIKDIVDTLTVDAITVGKDTVNGHRHKSMYTPAATKIVRTDNNNRISISNNESYVSSTTTSLGIGRSAGFAFLNIESFSDTTTDAPAINFKKSHTDTINSTIATVDGEVLMQILPYGVESANGEDSPGGLFFKQDGTNGTYVPCKFELYTSDNSETPQLQLVVDKNGDVAFTENSFFANDKQVRFGSSLATPFAYIEWDTGNTELLINAEATSTGAIRLKTNCSGTDINLQTSGGNIVLTGDLKLGQAKTACATVSIAGSIPVKDSNGDTIFLMYTTSQS